MKTKNKLKLKSVIEDRPIVLLKPVNGIVHYVLKDDKGNTYTLEITEGEAEYLCSTLKKYFDVI